MLIILLLPLRGQVYLKYDNDDIESDFELYLFFIKIKMPDGSREKDSQKDDKAKEKKQENENEEKEKHGGGVWRAVNTVLDNLPAIKKLISSVLGYVYKHLIKIKAFIVHAELGVDDAMYTALLYGALSAFIYNLAGIMDEHMRLSSYDIDVKPDFNNPHITAEFKAILSTNILHLIIIAVIAAGHGVPLWLKIKKKEKNNG